MYFFYIRYEDLSTDPNHVIAELINFLELPPNIGLFKFVETHMRSEVI